MKFPYTATCILALTTCIVPVASQAQAPNSVAPASSPSGVAGTPESVVAQYIEGMRRKDWASSAALMHPDALQQLKKMFRPLVFAAPNLEMGKMFFNVRTTAEFDRLSGQQAYQRLMVALTRLNPEVGSAMTTTKSEIIGHVIEGQDTAHVVYRMTNQVQGMSVTKLGVMPLKKAGATWRGLLTGDIEGMAAALSRMAKPQPTPKTAANKAPKVTARP